MGEAEFRKIVGKNIVKHRKRLGLTQIELAQKLNYTDKSISKWERAETLPDAFMIKQLADLFNITVDVFIVVDDNALKKSNINSLTKKRIAIPFLAVLLNFFVATIVFCFLTLFKVQISNIWIVFIYSISSASIILIIFSSKWWNKFMTAISVSMLNWSLALSLFLSIADFNNKSWLFFIIAAGFQVLIIAWFSFLSHKEV